MNENSKELEREAHHMSLQHVGRLDPSDVMGPGGTERSDRRAEQIPAEHTGRHDAFEPGCHEGSEAEAGDDSDDHAGHVLGRVVS